MGALDPISGISLEKYAELCAKMAGCGGDLEKCAVVATENGVDRETWESAMNGWNARMYDPTSAAEVALAYMPLYQAALSKYGGPAATATLEEYAEMLAVIQTDLSGERKRPTSFDAMYERFNIDAPKWSQISTYWVEQLGRDPQLGKQSGDLFTAFKKRFDEEYLNSLSAPGQGV